MVIERLWDDSEHILLLGNISPYEFFVYHRGVQNWCAQKVRVLLPDFACELEMLLGVDWCIGELLKYSRSRDLSQPCQGA